MEQKIIRIQETAAEDPDYLALLEEYRELGSSFLELLESLPRKDAGLIEDYLGIVGELHRRQLIIACKL